MTCPHCLKEIDAVPSYHYIDKDEDGDWAVRAIKCPACNRLSLALLSGTWIVSESRMRDGQEFLAIRPRGAEAERGRRESTLSTLQAELSELRVESRKMLETITAWVERATQAEARLEELRKGTGEDRI